MPWLDNFKHFGDKSSENNGSDKFYWEKFSNITSVFDVQNLPKLFYNADETRLLWKYIARKTYLTAEESAPSTVKNSTEQLILFICSNTTDTHKCKFLIISKSVRSKA